MRYFNAGLALTCFVLLIFGCGQEEVPTQARPVLTMTVGHSEGLAWRRFPGVAAAVDHSVFSFRVSGLVQDLEVDVGEEVEAGQVLARLDPADFELAVENAQGELDSALATLQAMVTGAREEIQEQRRAEVESAQATFDRVEADHQRYITLREEGVVSQSEFENVESRFRSTQAELHAAQQRLLEAERGARQEDVDAQRALIESLRAQLSNAQNNLSYAVLEATFDGLIVTRDIEPGQNVQAQERAFYISNLDLLEMTIGIPEEMYQYRDRVEEVQVGLNQLPDHDFEATQRLFSPDLDPQSQTYPLEVRFENAERLALPGMSGNVRLGLRSAEAEGGSEIMIPIGAILDVPAGGKAVWVVLDGAVHLQPVETRVIGEDLVPIVSGLEVGDVIVTAGVNFLVEGMAVRSAEGAEGSAP
jgi:RND family efflux transporter MFP subunit